MQQRTAETDQHQRTGPPKRIAERIEGAVKQGRRHPPGEHRQIAARLGFDARFDLRQREQRVGVEQETHPRNRQQHGQPECLLQRPGDLAVTLRAAQMRYGRRHRLQDADQREHHRNIDAAADRHSGQILGAIVTEQRGVDHHHAHRGKLGNQHR